MAQNEVPFYCLTKDLEGCQDCKNCSLVNYGKDCMNFPITWSKEAKEEAFSYLPFNVFINKPEEKRT